MENVTTEQLHSVPYDFICFLPFKIQFVTSSGQLLLFPFFLYYIISRTFLQFVRCLSNRLSLCLLDDFFSKMNFYVLCLLFFYFCRTQPTADAETASNLSCWAVFPVLLLRTSTVENEQQQKSSWKCSWIKQFIITRYEQTRKQCARKLKNKFEMKLSINIPISILELWIGKWIIE